MQLIICINYYFNQSLNKSVIVFVILHIFSNIATMVEEAICQISIVYGYTK